MSGRYASYWNAFLFLGNCITSVDDGLDKTILNNLNSFSCVTLGIKSIGKDPAVTKLQLKGACVNTSDVSMHDFKGHSHRAKAEWNFSYTVVVYSFPLSLSLWIGVNRPFNKKCNRYLVEYVMTKKV